VTIKLPDAPKGEDPNHRLPLSMLAEAKLVMTDALMNMARDDQAEHPIDEDEDIETVELPSDDPEADEAEDTADQSTVDTEEDTSEEIT
jgi:ribosome maturation factor RimP